MFPALSALRASDAEREQTVAFLNRRCGEGRLDLDELDSRVEAAYAAVMLAELDALTRDLPGSPFAPAPVTTSRSTVARRHLTAGLTVLTVVALLAIVPAEIWAPLLMLAVPLVAMLLFAVLPFAVPAILLVLVVRGLTRGAGDRY